MTNRFIAAALLLAAVAAPLAAQGGMEHGTKVRGSGKLPAGWNVRFDAAGSALTEVDVRQAGTALAFRTGPAGIYWNTKDIATGSYTVSATFVQKKSMQQEAYGIFVGGQNLSDPTQNYLYFAIKPQAGTFLINHRSGNGRPRAIVSLTPSPAINKDAPGTGAATNAIAIRVAKDSLHFYVNGVEVRTFAKSALPGVVPDGIAGLRINHSLDIEVRDFKVGR
ncbi:MAG TPA: hypothetical protein VFO55_08640 [Gemmatimonadaceae bacterium]|nr:hypothetical protein [Gemmatimonadaceae bacterium]